MLSRCPKRITVMGDLTNHQPLNNQPLSQTTKQPVKSLQKHLIVIIYNLKQPPTVL